MSSTFVTIGALLAALAVGLGAFGAHGLKTLVEQNKLTPKDLDTFQTAVHYQMIHALGLVLIGLIGAARPSGMLDAAGWTMLLGILIFSGFLYAYVATGARLFAMFVPVGGLAFILAWLCLAVAAMRKAP